MVVIAVMRAAPPRGVAARARARSSRRSRRVWFSIGSAFPSPVASPPPVVSHPGIRPSGRRSQSAEGRGVLSRITLRPGSAQQLEGEPSPGRGHRVRRCVYSSWRTAATFTRMRSTTGRVSSCMMQRVLLSIQATSSTSPPSSTGCDAGAADSSPLATKRLHGRARRLVEHMGWIAPSVRARSR